MESQPEHSKQKGTAEEAQGNQIKKEESIVIKIPPQRTALKEAAKKGDPYCEIIEEDNQKN